MPRALSFGTVAESYERFRPDYPAELADLVLAYAGRPVRTALEIGAGTGKATRLFADRGVTLTATEPDPAMTDVRQSVIERRPTVSAGEFVGHLSTVSAYLELPAPERAEVFRRISRVLPPTVEITADVIVHLARRRTG